MLFRSGAVLAPFLFLFWVYCILDVIATDEVLVRNLNKMMWLMVVILLNVVGGLAWFVLGRPEKAGWRPGDTDYSKRPPSWRGLEDSPGYSGGTAAGVPRRERPSSPPPKAMQMPVPTDGDDKPAIDPPQRLSDDSVAMLRRQHELDQREAELARREEQLKKAERDAKDNRGS